MYQQVRILSLMNHEKLKFVRKKSVVFHKITPRIPVYLRVKKKYIFLKVHYFAKRDYFAVLSNLHIIWTKYVTFFGIHFNFKT